MSSFLVLCEGNTRNRWRDGQVGTDVRQGTMAPWARRLGRRERRKEVGRRGRVESGRENGRKESGIGVKKTMNACGVENGL
ncbi:hypothetical protein TNCV_2207031 [Trichonephila clavipes]|uniref:Uncharacterized protein n=1 Tax=Trichonephila clavipes TaxID=2585209 RepID=A0A8X6V574_TRICX|nr:hypothetical protein TNCV_2207031 [Trichonephila clavipes]